MCMVNLHSIFCKVDANSNKLFVLLEPPQFLSVPVSTIDYDNLFEIAVHQDLVKAQQTWKISGRILEFCLDQRERTLNVMS